MTTVRQIERCWNAKEYGRLFRELIASRPEGVFRLEVEPRARLAAALAVIRLDELCQSHVPLYSRLVRAILAAQTDDGGWGDSATTALCVRALLCGGGNGVAVERGVEYLAQLQKDEGIWPAVPLRRMPADAHISVFIFSQLGDSPTFRDAVRWEAAADWLERHADELDDDTHELWSRARLRCSVRYVESPVMDLAWLGVA